MSEREEWIADGRWTRWCRARNDVCRAATEWYQWQKTAGHSDPEIDEALYVAVKEMLESAP